MRPVADDDLRVPGDTPKPRPLIADDDLRIPGASGPPRPLMADDGRRPRGDSMPAAAKISSHVRLPATHTKTVIVGVDGSDVTLLKVRREDLAPTKDNLMQRELEIGENVVCLYPHAGRYRLTCKAPGLRLCGPSLKTFSSRDFMEKGPLQLTL